MICAAYAVKDNTALSYTVATVTKICWAFYIAKLEL